MNLGKAIMAWFFLFVSTFSEAQEKLIDYNFTETSSDSLKLATYTDTLYKYLYRDVDISLFAIESAEEILKNEDEIADSLIFNYKLNRIYHELNMIENLKAYQTIIECETELDWNEISTNSKTKFNYIKAFTYMIFDDLEAAQKSYLENIRLGREIGDTSKVIINLFSLGQLYSDENDFQEAIKCYTEIIENKDSKKVSSGNVAQTYGELAETYMQMEEFEKAILYVDKAIDISEKEELKVLQYDFLLLKGNLYLRQNKIKNADEVYAILNKMNSGVNDENNIINIQRFLCRLQINKKKYQEASYTMSSIMNQTNPNDVDLKISNYKTGIEIYEALGNYKKAFEFSQANSKLKKQKALDSKRQKTEYLKVKYKSEESARENELLNLELRAGKSKQKFLYLISAISGLLLFFLYGAFTQKGRYNKKLKEEVTKRTEKLNKSNEELKEFNKILSHDLKEPVRSIVGFSQLANKNSDPIKIKEQLGYITKSAYQLNHLIENSIKYRNLEQFDSEETSQVNLAEILDKVVAEAKLSYPEKEIILNKENLISIKSNKKLMEHLLKSIIDNSVKFNNHKTVNIKASYKKLNNQHNLTLEDNGIGIPRKYHKQVFNRFTRLNHRNKYGGSGLGLSIAKKLVEKMNGKISIKGSTEDEGTTILLQIPA